jgi:hypothetical protein
VLVVLHRAFQEFGLGDDSHELGFSLAKHLTAVLHNVWRYRYGLDETSIDSIISKLPAPPPLPWADSWYSEAFLHVYFFYLWTHSKVEEVYMQGLQPIYWDTKFGIDDCRLLYDLAYIYRYCDMRLNAFRLYAFCLHEIWKTKSPFHPQSLTVHGDVAWTWYEFRCAESVETLFLKYIWLHQARKRVLGKNHPATAGALLGIGSILNSQGFHSEAFRILHTALAIRETVLGVDDILT